MQAGDANESAWISARDAASAAEFHTTLWTKVVVAAGQRDSPDSDAALARLCQIYWRPVYAFIRRRSPSPEQAQDLTQSFFARLLEKNQIARADRNRGRFRSFLMSSVQNFLCDEHDRATSLKRGGSEAPISLDATLADEEEEPAALLTPAVAFEKRWAKSLLDQVMTRLASEYRESGRGSLFDALQPHLWGDAEAMSYDDLSHRLNISSVNVRVSAHRLRHRYREILRDEIAQTVTDPEEIESEIRYLQQVLSR